MTCSTALAGESACPPFRTESETVAKKDLRENASSLRRPALAQSGQEVPRSLGLDLAASLDYPRRPKVPRSGGSRRVRHDGDRATATATEQPLQRHPLGLREIPSVRLDGG